MVPIPLLHPVRKSQGGAATDRNARIRPTRGTQEKGELKREEDLQEEELKLMSTSCVFTGQGLLVISIK